MFNHPNASNPVPQKLLVVRLQDWNLPAHKIEVRTPERVAVEPVAKLVRRLDMLFENPTALFICALARLRLVLHLSLFLLGFLAFPQWLLDLLGLENSFAECINDYLSSILVVEIVNKLRLYRRAYELRYK